MVTMKKLLLDLSMVSEETLRSVEELLLLELSDLHMAGEDKRHDALSAELRKLESHFSE